ncbi:hypothetical protein HHK36_020826 [Tetracentron sinense]|uniref:MYND-type domain-containing protein n=1 Tax=Tetracentron sinense TaxID=13715 RepID=A0A834Z0J2_TETSI|nr:hypothetical protein HHK36_020826 [Tetracentron sinense]
MSNEMEIAVNGDSPENFSSLRISSLQEEEQVEEEEEEDDDDDEEEEEDEEQEPVTLGFLEKSKSHCSLLHQLFPSKAGGVPAWLDPVDLPSERSRLCDICGEPLQFLLQVYIIFNLFPIKFFSIRQHYILWNITNRLDKSCQTPPQVYAPISEKESTFHRTIFVFMCLSMACLLKDQHEQWKRRPDKPSRSVKVFRCQLPRKNPFYSSEPPRHDGTDKPSGIGAALCTWCGTWKGDKVCSSCRKAHYCSEKHQATHWHSGHRIDCRQMSISLLSSESSPSNSRTSSPKMPKAVASSTLWPAFEIINEDECAFDLEVSEDNNYASSLVSKDRMDGTVKSLSDNFEGDGDKNSWASFQVRIAKAPEQVLRYCRDAKAKPLWPMSSGRLSKADIPKCNYCGGPLCFEFQV